jgi:enterochelin esterase-like enzyme
MRTRSVIERFRSSGFICIIALAVMCLALRAQAAIEAPLPQVPVGRIVRLARFPSQYVAPHNIDVWLPAGYPRQAPYAVLYMFDGQNVFGGGNTWNHQSWQAAATASRLIAWGKTRPFIIVAIWNSPLRMSEYYPQKPWESLTPAQRRMQFGRVLWGQQVLPVAPFSDTFLQFMTQELMPAIDRRFAVNASRDATFVMGSSMGGLLAWYAMARYPRVFGGAACLSTHWPGASLSLEPAQDDPAPDAFVRYIREQFPSPAHHRLYFDHGTRTLDAWYGPTQRRVDRILAAKGWVGNHLETLVFPGADHSERSWSARLAIPMTFLLAPPAYTPRRPAG